MQEVGKSWNLGKKKKYKKFKEVMENVVERKVDKFVVSIYYI